MKNKISYILLITIFIICSNFYNKNVYADYKDSSDVLSSTPDWKIWDSEGNILTRKEDIEKRLKEVAVGGEKGYDDDPKDYEGDRDGSIAVIKLKIRKKDNGTYYVVGQDNLENEDYPLMFAESIGEVYDDWKNEGEDSITIWVELKYKPISDEECLVLTGKSYLPLDDENNNEKTNNNSDNDSSNDTNEDNTSSNNENSDNDGNDNEDSDNDSNDNEDNVDVNNSDSDTTDDNFSIDDAFSIEKRIENRRELFFKMVDFIKDFKIHPGETIADLLLDLLIALGDLLQGRADAFWPIKGDEDEYLKYSEGNVESENQIKAVTIEIDENLEEYEKERKRYGKEFTEDTPIPLSQVDLYTMALRKIDAFDVNFLDLKVPEGEKSSWWMVIRRFAVTIIRITFYVGAAFIITMLIWSGVRLAYGTLTPNQRRNHMEGIKKFSVSFLMLIGSVLIMAVGIYASKMFFEDFGIGDDVKELPIRVYVEEMDYSFSTNITGLTRYKASTENIMLYWKKGAYAIEYLMLSILNLVGANLMFFRMLAMMGLSVIGPVIAALYAINKEKIVKISYKDWAKWYLIFASIQFFMSLTCRLIIDISI